MYYPMTSKPCWRTSGVAFLQLMALYVTSVWSSAAIADEYADTSVTTVSQNVIVVANPESRVVNLRSDLDLGIRVSTEIPMPSGTQAEASFRKTEAQILAAKQRSVFEKSGHWGVVRLYPEYSVIPELMLELVVLKSDGRELLIRVNLTAVNGDLLLADTYLDRSVSETLASEPRGAFCRFVSPYSP